MKNTVIGILAHVDAGKTTLSEAFFYQSGVIRQAGRVDNKDAFLDHNEMERARGITIFSKQAFFSWKNTVFTLLDTPGHVDFSAEAERCLKVLDYAVLVVSAPDGVQGHTLTLWKLLKQLGIPTFLFINKMDLANDGKEALMEHLRKSLDYGCMDFSEIAPEGEALEEMALLGDKLEEFLESGTLSDESICGMIHDRNIFPCFFGSALKLDGTEALLDGMDRYTVQQNAETDAFRARVYKITHDEQGKRLTHLKVLSGVLRTRDILCGDEKVSQIRRYNGERYEACNETQTGCIYAVTGPEETYAGQGIGDGMSDENATLEPVLSYRITFPEGTSPLAAIRDLRLLEGEMPELNVVWDEEHKEIHVRVMGQIQIDILKQLVKERFSYAIAFDKGSIAYKETIADTVIGVGHFEPLRHYAETHIRIEPGERGSGISVTSDCSEDVLERNWQRLIATHLTERIFRGVKTGAPLTDVKFAIINGRAHNKHTEGGDFRQATYRAVRQGLMQAESVLLEPFYDFTLEIPTEMVGRAMTDLTNLHAKMTPCEIMEDVAVMTGRGPVATLRDYQIELQSYTHGKGHLSVAFGGYDVCHNADEVIKAKGYDPDADKANPSASVFCAHGSGFQVPWYEVFEYMHVKDEVEYSDGGAVYQEERRRRYDFSLGTDEVDEIINRTFHANAGASKSGYKKQKTQAAVSRSYKEGEYVYRPVERKEKVLLVDGYNVIFAWDELKALSSVNLDTAKDRLVSILSKYQSINDYRVKLVFDGYRVKGSAGSTMRLEDIEIVHTKEGEKADQYIESYTQKHGKELDILVVSSDSLIRQITGGHNCRVVSSAEFLLRMEQELETFRKQSGLQ